MQKGLEPLGWGCPVGPVGIWGYSTQIQPLASWGRVAGGGHVPACSGAGRSCPGANVVCSYWKLDC